MQKHALIVGSGLGGLATALRLGSKGYRVTILEKYHQAGGRLNRMEKDGFTFDVGPSFFSMSYEFDELFQSCGLENPLTYQELDPLYGVYFAHRQEPFLVHKNLEKLQLEFAEVERNLAPKAEQYLREAGQLFHDTEYRIVKRNYGGLLDYAWALLNVPLRHAPKLFRSMWKELERHFDGEETKIVFSLVAFFLGATPFNTPAVYSLLNYTELKHNGYWSVEGGMYTIVEKICELLTNYAVEWRFNTEITGYEAGRNGELRALTDQNGERHQADLFVINADAAAFRGKIFGRKKFREEKLDQLHWTLAPFTLYLGVRGKIDNLYHHTYFLGSNFREYATDIFRTATAPEKPYYYVNVSSKSNPNCAPEGCENLFVLCPVPDRRFKPEWDDAEELASTIIRDIGQRTGFDLENNILTQTILTPIDWEKMFNLYRGSGLGLAHGLDQVAGMRPANKDETFGNVYYCGASTVPGTGLPIVVISSKLAVERIEKEHGSAV